MSRQHHLTAVLGPDLVEDIGQRTDLDSDGIIAISKRYNFLDPTRGEDNIAFEDATTIPELSTLALGRLILEYFLDEDRTLTPYGFAMIAGLLYSETAADKKRFLLWQMLGGQTKTDSLKPAAMMKLYTQLLSGAVSHANIEKLVARIYQNRQQLTYDEFEKLIPDRDIQLRLTCDFYTGV